MSPTEIGLFGVVILIILLFSGLPVGFAMALAGFLGFCYVVDLSAGLSLVARDVFDMFSSYGLTVLPLFVFMGQISFFSGISRRLYDSANVLM